MPTDLLPLMLTSLTVGFLGSTHCIAMCGGIVSALNLQNSALPNRTSYKTSRQTLIAQCLYSCGRIASYMAAGLLVGLLGQTALNFTGAWALPLARALAAIMMILIGLYLTQWWTLLIHLERIGASQWQRINQLLSPMIPADRWYKAVIVGALWGWIPCGLVYSALIMAATTQSVTHAAMVMLFFGIGTLPAIFSVGLLTQRLNLHKLKKWSGVILIAFGLSSLSFQLYHTIAHQGSHHSHHNSHDHENRHSHHNHQ